MEKKHPKNTTFRALKLFGTFWWDLFAINAATRWLRIGWCKLSVVLHLHAPFLKMWVVLKTNMPNCVSPICSTVEGFNKSFYMISTFCRCKVQHVHEILHVRPSDYDKNAVSALIHALPILSFRQTIAQVWQKL